MFTVVDGAIHINGGLVIIVAAGLKTYTATIVKYWLFSNDI